MSLGFQLVVAFFVAAAVSALVIALMLRSGRAGPLDNPNHRSLHSVAVPRSGGVGVLAGLACAGAAWVPPPAWLVALALLAAVSWWDDCRPLSAPLRFAVHLLAAVVVLDTLGAGPAGAVVLIFALVWMANLYNFMDGANGLAGGMALLGFLALSVAAALTGQHELAGWAVAIAGAALGFLRFNFHPARIFLGDIGSVTLGFLAALLGWYGWMRQAWPLWFPVLAFSPFIVDATATLLRRLLRGEKVWQAHREHYYQRLVRMGWSHRRLALSEYALMSAVAVTAVMLLEVSPVWQWAGVATWGVIYVVLMRWIDTLWQRTHVA